MSLFFALAMLGAPAVSVTEPDRLMLCYVAKGVPDGGGFTPTGEFRKLVLRFPDVPGNSVAGNLVQVDDPTQLLLGRPVRSIVQNNPPGSFGIMTEGPKEDTVAVVVMPAEAGKVGGQAMVMRTEKDKPLSYVFVGVCALPPTTDPDADFQALKDLPDTRS